MRLRNMSTYATLLTGVLLLVGMLLVDFVVSAFWHHHALRERRARMRDVMEYAALHLERAPGRLAALPADPAFCLYLLTKNGIDYDAARAAFNDTYLLDVLQAYQLGIVAGKSPGKFEPNESISRREAAVMLTNAAKLVGKDSLDGDALDYEDAADIAWAATYVDFVTRAGIMGSTSTGRALFNPLGYYTQEQALTTMCNLLP